jgi:AraC-like DNA-binding protein
MADIPLVRARYIKSFARALSQRGVAIAGPLANAGLDERVLQFPENYVAMSQLHTFVTSAVAVSGYYHLGLDAGISPRVSHSDFSRELALAPKLYDTLMALIGDSKTEDTTATFRVVSGQGFTWLTCGRVRGDAEAARQVELYRYAGLLEVIRYASGPDWLPPALQLQSQDDGRLRDVPLIREVDVTYGSSRLAIAMEPEWLGKPLRSDDPLLDRSAPVRAPTGPVSLDDEVREIVRTQVRIGKFTLGDLTKALTMSPRSLQRCLGEVGTTFSGLLEEVRIEYAQSMLANLDAPVSAVSDSLGYRHGTHFSRAFKRVTGVTPREYRRNAGRG